MIHIMVPCLSGGFFAGKVAAPDAQAPTGGRFDPSSKMGQMYRARYFKRGFFDALNYLKPIAVSHSSIFTAGAMLNSTVLSLPGEAPASSYGDSTALVSAPLGTVARGRNHSGCE